MDSKCGKAVCFLKIFWNEEQIANKCILELSQRSVPGTFFAQSALRKAQNGAGFWLLVTPAPTVTTKEKWNMIMIVAQ